jgi:glutathione S-transferase
MKLYYSPGSCSLSPHIALREAGLNFDLVQVDLKVKKTRTGEDYLAINPKGYVPALGLDDGSLLTEGAVIVQYVADRNPDARLAPSPGSAERYRLQEWLHFIATELHKSFGPINNPRSNPEIREFFGERVRARFRILETALETRRFLLGEQFSVADGYAYYALRSLQKLDNGAIQASTTLSRYVDSLESRQAVRTSLEVEGLRPLRASPSSI